MDAASIGRPTFGGLASGLDTSALLDGLLAVERIPLQRIEQQREDVSSQRGLMRELNTKLLALRTASQQLDNRTPSGAEATATEEFLSYQGVSTDEEVVQVSASSGAAPGDIEIVVNELARASREFSTAFTEETSASALAFGESITIALDNADPDAIPEAIEATTITITNDEEGSVVSLADLRDRINTSADNGGKVRADILRESDDVQRLVLTSAEAGPENQITVTGAITTDEALREEARGSRFTVFGQSIERSSNVVDDVLTGITLRLEKLSEIEDPDLVVADGEDPVDPVRLAETVTVEIDVDEVASKLEAFTTAYNDVMSFMDRQFRFNEATGTAGPLSGDSTLRRIQSDLRGFVADGFRFQGNPNNPFTNQGQGGTISGVGIDIGGGGTLSIDREKLEEALALDALSVREFFSGRPIPESLIPETDPDSNEPPPPTYDNGFAELFSTRLDELTRSGDGLLAERDAAYVRRLDDFDDSIDRFSRRIEKREETLIQRFSDLERIVAGLQSQQGFLGSL